MALGSSRGLYIGRITHTGFGVVLDRGHVLWRRRSVNGRETCAYKHDGRDRVEIIVNEGWRMRGMGIRLQILQVCI
jgi:hypothetical protein